MAVLAARDNPPPSPVGREVIDVLRSRVDRPQYRLRGDAAADQIAHAFAVAPAFPQGVFPARAVLRAQLGDADVPRAPRSRLALVQEAQLIHVPLAQPGALPHGLPLLQGMHRYDRRVGSVLGE